EYSVSTLSVDQGLSAAGITCVLAARDGAIWMGTTDGLTRWDRGQITIFRERSGEVKAGVRQITARGLPDLGVHSLLQDSHGRVWLASRRGAGYLENDRYVPIDSFPQENVHSMAESSNGDLWIATQEHGLVQLSQGRKVEEIPWSKLGFSTSAGPIIADP